MKAVQLGARVGVWVMVGVGAWVFRTSGVMVPVGACVRIISGVMVEVGA